ncbi:MAG: hypothetical protein AAF821_18885 [Cyanobacteria bacterium P01_D01_bin.156]
MRFQNNPKRLWTKLSKKQQATVQGGQLFPVGNGGGNGGGWWRPGAGRGESPVPNAINNYSDLC